MDYNLHGLNPRDFQHMVQAIARKVISPAVVAHGDGPDGARDFSYSGRTLYPTSAEPWDGYVVGSCKFHQIPESPAKNLSWLKKQLKKDLEQFQDKSRNLRRPDYYLLVSNVRLSSGNSDGRGQIEKLLAAAGERLSLRGTGLWDYNDLRGFLDGNADIRTAYGALITSGDVLRLLAKTAIPDSTSFAAASALFLEKELHASMAAKLQAAGEDPELRIPLSAVFFDLPFAGTPEEATRDPGLRQQPRVVETLLRSGARVLRPSLQQRRLQDIADQTGSAEGITRTCADFVIVGGPGQGKSTVAQYLCQLYRAAILRDALDGSRAHPQTPKYIRQLEESAGALSLPVARRFPVHVELKAFSGALEAARGLTLMEFIRRDLEQLANMPIQLSDLRRWLEAVPWLLVLDGLDEVPPSSNRSEVMKQIEDFRIDAAAVDSDLMIVATTRPQSYSQEFGANSFLHIYLAPLGPELALKYGTKLVHAKHDNDPRRRQELFDHLMRASKNPATAHLMQSPLQVTIMATLLEETGEPPQQRFRLFMEYYRTIYRRETRRNVLRGILSERQVDIDFIHAHAGLLMQAAGEPFVSGSKKGSVVRTDAGLTNDQFRSVVEFRLSDVGVPQNVAHDLAQRISDSSLQRLVFLVRQQEGHVRFDITSLQEFMAAEALMAGADAAVKERLQAIAAASYWRNVLLFCVGKCFVQKEHLLADVISICTQLNNSAAASDLVGSQLGGELAQSVLAGSRLALDILVDGSAKQAFKFESQLARIALELVRIPDSSIHARLASVWTPQLSSQFVSAVEDRLGLSNFWDQLGAWQLLLAAADRGQGWATQLADEHWPTSMERRSYLIMRRNWQVSDWIRNKAFGLADQLGPEFLNRPLLTTHAQLSQWPDRWRAFRGFDRKVMTTRIAAAPRALSIIVPEVRIQPLAGCANLAQTLRHFDVQQPGWAMWNAAAQFGERPTARVLGRQLRILANVTDAQWRHDWTFPWPLSACLGHARTREELLELAERAERGAFGDTEQWLAAEQRWKNKGIGLDDVGAMSDDAWPMRPDMSALGFPFAASLPYPNHLLILGGDPAQLVQPMQEAMAFFKELPAGHSAVVSWFAKRFIENASFGVRGALFSLPDLSLIVSWLSIRDASSMVVSLDAISPADRINASAGHVEALRTIGSSAVRLAGEKPWENIEVLTRAITQDPRGNKGLLRILVQLAAQGSRVELPRWVIDDAREQGTKEAIYADQLLLTQRDLTEGDINPSINRLMRSGDRKACGMALRIAEHNSFGIASQAAKFALAQCRVASEEDMDTKEAAHDAALKQLAAIPSRLQVPGVWERVQLPPRL